MKEIKDLQLKLEELSKFYSIVRESVLTISEKTRIGKFKKGELCDLGFLCREFVSTSEEIRKDIGATKVLVDKMVCIISLTQLLQDPTMKDTVKGTLCSGKPHYKKSVTLPRKDTPEYLEMCKYFGITPQGIESGVAKISWKKVCNHVTELAEMGKPIPDFIPKIHDDYTVIHRRK